MDLSREEEFKDAVKTMLDIMGEDISREGLIDTPKRVFNAYKHIYSGYDMNPKDILNSALFSTTNDEMVVVKDIEFYSNCEHHMLPIIGKAHIGYIPNGKVVGLSKIPRIVNIFARRLQIQEQLTEDIAQAIQDVVNPKGVGVIIEARHMCIEMRGVEKINSQTVTTALRGDFKDDKSIKSEFLSTTRL
jgi:GTP cyclohydrolase I